MMSIQAIVKRQRKTRKGRGFNKKELKEVGLSFSQALKLNIPIDIRRSAVHKENTDKLRTFLTKDRKKQVKKQPKKQVKKQIKDVVKELSDVKGIGPKLSEKLKKGGINTANKLAKSNPEKIAQVIGSSNTRASKLIESALSLVNEKR